MHHTFLYALLFVISAIHTTKHLYSVSYASMFSIRISQNRTNDSASLCEFDEFKKALAQYTTCFWFMECAQKAWFTFVNWCFRVTIHFWTFHIYAILFFTTQPEHTILEVWFLAKYHKISLSLECEIVSLSLIQCSSGSVQQWVKHGWILSSVHFYFDHFAHSFRSILKIYGFDCFSCHHNHP